MVKTTQHLSTFMKISLEVDIMYIQMCATNYDFVICVFDNKYLNKVVLILAHKFRTLVNTENIIFYFIDL